MIIQYSKNEKQDHRWNQTVLSTVSHCDQILYCICFSSWEGKNGIYTNRIQNTKKMYCNVRQKGRTNLKILKYKNICVKHEIFSPSRILISQHGHSIKAIKTNLKISDQKFKNKNKFPLWWIYKLQNFTQIFTKLYFSMKSVQVPDKPLNSKY